MPITPKFTREDIEKRFHKYLEVIENRILARLQYLGEKCVTHARLVPASVGFTDQTGNLRASIGYMIFKDGETMYDGFEGSGEDFGGDGGALVGHANGGAAGVITGRKVAKQAATDYPRGIVLVVVAGMEYAAAVESRGRDVLTSAELLAKNEMPRLVEKIKEQVSKAMR